MGCPGSTDERRPRGSLAGWDLRARTVRIPYRDPFRIARDSHGAGASMTTVIVELRSGTSSGSRRATARDTPTPTTARPSRRWPWSWPAPRGGRPAASLDRRRPRAARASLAAAGAAFDAAIRGHGAAKCALDIALHDLLGKATRRCPSTGSSGSPPTSRRRTSRWASTSPRSSRSAPAGRAGSRRSRSRSAGPADLATLEAVRAVLRRAAARRRQHGLDARDGGRACCPELVRLGVELIEQPFPARRARLAARPPGRARRCPSWPTRAPWRSRTSTRWSASSPAST